MKPEIKPQLQIELFPYERHALETLEREFGIERETVVGFAQSLNALTKVFEKMLGGAGQEFRDGRIVIMGFINHAHHLLVGGLQALEAGNGRVWSACVRGLMETFGACVMIFEKPDSVTNHLEHVTAGKLYSAAERGRPGLGADIKRLHKIVHPASGAICSGFKVVDDKKRYVEFSFGLHRPEPSAGREGVVVLANLALLLEEKLEALANNQTVLSAGKVVMDSRCGEGGVLGCTADTHQSNGLPPRRE